MTRSQFLRLVAGLGALSLTACKKSEDTPVDAPGGGDAPGADDGGIDSPPGIDAPPGACTATRSAIGGNHGHALAVSAADVAAGVEKSYDIQGGSAHPHTVVVTAAMFADLQQAKPVTVASSEDADHVHNVTITCV